MKNSVSYTDELVAARLVIDSVLNISSENQYRYLPSIIKLFDLNIILADFIGLLGTITNSDFVTNEILSKKADEFIELSEEIDGFFIEYVMELNTILYSSLLKFMNHQAEV